jgi:hypothetical protein
VIAPFAVVAAAYFFTHHHQVEIDPYAGFVWPPSVSFSDMATHLRDQPIYGVKASAYVTDNLQVEGNFGYMNHFESRFVPTVVDQSFGVRPQTVHGLLYDINGVWNFVQPTFLGPHFTPYVVGGIGGLTTEVRNAKVALIGGQFYQTTPTNAVVFSPTQTVTVHDNTAFFSVNYGAGIKTIRTWGPMGFRADFRGRTFPNFRGQSMTWPEATGGLTFTFGEK